MKKLIKFKARQMVVTEIEVDFPIYSRHDIDGDGWSHTIFTRHEEDGTRYSVQVTADEMDIEIRKYSLDGSDPDYVLGRGQYESSAAEFAAALEKAKAFLAKVPG